ISKAITTPAHIPGLGGEAPISAPRPIGTGTSQAARWSERMLSKAMGIALARSARPNALRTVISIACRSPSMHRTRYGSASTTFGSTAQIASPLSIFRRANSMTGRTTGPERAGESPTRLLGSYLTGAATAALFAFVAGAWAENAGWFSEPDNALAHRDQAAEAIIVGNQTPQDLTQRESEDERIPASSINNPERVLTNLTVHSAGRDV